MVCALTKVQLLLLLFFFFVCLLCSHYMWRSHASPPTHTPWREANPYWALTSLTMRNSSPDDSGQIGAKPFPSVPEHIVSLRWLCNPETAAIKQHSDPIPQAILTLLFFCLDGGKKTLAKLFQMGTHSSALAWRIPGMGEPGGLPSMGSHRVGHDWSDLAAAAAADEDTSQAALFTEGKERAEMERRKLMIEKALDEWNKVVQW